MEDNKEKTTETTTTASVTVTDSSKENDSSVNMSVSSPTSNDVKKEEEATNKTTDESINTKTNLITLTVKTPKEKETVQIHPDASVKEVDFFFSKISFCNTIIK